MHKPEPVPLNEMHDIFWDFEIQMDHLILTRRQDLVIVNEKKKKKKKEPAEFVVLADNRVKIKENETREIST